MLNVRSWFGFVVFGLASLAVLFPAALVEYTLPIYIPWFVAPLFALLWLAFLFPFLRENHLKIRFLIPVVFLMGFASIHFSRDSRGAFIRHLHSVKPGMSIEQVEARMSRYNVFRTPNTKRLASGKLELVKPNLAIYYHEYPEDRFNADAAVIVFKNDKVQSTHFSPD